MSDWKKLQLTDKHAELKSLRLSGTTTASMIADPNYDTTAQDLHLQNLFGGNLAWLDNVDNTNAEGDPWISEYREVDILGSGAVLHRLFIASDGSSTPDSGTGPDYGIAATSNATQATIQQTGGARYLYTDIDNEGLVTYSMTSPHLDLTHYATKKLVFYFFLYGSNCGTLKVYTSTSADHIEGQQLIMNYTGENGTFAYTHYHIVGQIQTDSDDPWHRLEVDLSTENTNGNPTLNEGYIWIVYESDGGNSEDPDLAELSICNLFLELDDLTVPLELPYAADDPTLKVYTSGANTNVSFLNLPESNPGIPGALYKREDPVIGFGNQSLIMISTGSA
jgi:hypothetical protein